MVTLPLGQLILFVSQFHLPARAANVVAVGVTAMVSYWLSRAWVWAPSGETRRREILCFVVVVVAGLLLSTWAAGWAAENASRVTTSPWATKLLVNSAAFTTFVMVWVGRFFVLDQMFGAGDAPPK